MIRRSHAWMKIGSFAVAIAGLAAVPAWAQLVPVKTLSADMALTLLTTAAKCSKSERVSIAIVDRNQVVTATFRGPLATLNTVDLARRKAASAAQFGRATGNPQPAGAGGQPGGAAPAGSAAASPQTEAQMLETIVQMLRNMNGQVNNIANNESGLGGAEPIKVGDETIAAIGISGTGPTEGTCAREAIAAIQDKLK